MLQKQTGRANIEEPSGLSCLSHVVFDSIQTFTFSAGIFNEKVPGLE